MKTTEKEYKCKYCDKSYNKYQSLGAHVPRCELNPKYKENLIILKTAKSKTHNRHTEKSRKALSDKRKQYIAQGGRILNGRGGEYKKVNYKSSWEIIFAIYCDLAGIDFKYESQKAYSYKSWTSDFEVDGELYEVGWHDHVESIQAFEADGWKCNLFKAEEINLMRKFIPQSLIKEYNLPKVDLKANRDRIKTFVPTMQEARDKAEKTLKRTLKAKEAVWFKDNNPKNTNNENVLIFKNTNSCSIFRQNFASKTYNLIATNESHVFVCEKIAYKLTCSGCNKEFEYKINRKKYCSASCQKAQSGLSKLFYVSKKSSVSKKSLNRLVCNYCNREFEYKTKRKKYCSASCQKAYDGFPWPSNKELQSLVDRMPLVVLADYLTEENGKKVSDNGIRKHCKKVGVQLKPLGFWAKKKNNPRLKEVYKPPFEKQILQAFVDEGFSCAIIAKKLR